MMLEEREIPAVQQGSLCTAIRVLDLQAWEDGGGGTTQEAKGRFTGRCVI